MLQITHLSEKEKQYWGYYTYVTLLKCRAGTISVAEYFGVEILPFKQWKERYYDRYNARE